MVIQKAQRSARTRSMRIISRQDAKVREKCHFDPFAKLRVNSGTNLS
jgi:hypothetical protein